MSPVPRTCWRCSSCAAVERRCRWEYVRRIFARNEDRDAATTLATRDAQLDAIHTWGIPNPTKLNRLAGITQPVLVANGDNDRMVQTHNSRPARRPAARRAAADLPGRRPRLPLPVPAEFAGEVEAFLTRA
jgi:hypothetical protein